MKQKNLITVVTDHQITADTIAKAIGANEKHEGYYLGNGYWKRRVRLTPSGTRD